MAICPGEVRARLNGGGIAPHIRRVFAGAHPCRHAARKAVGISRERRIKRAVIGGLIADDVDNAASRARALCRFASPFAGPARNAAAWPQACL